MSTVAHIGPVVQSWPARLRLLADNLMVQFDECRTTERYDALCEAAYRGPEWPADVAPKLYAAQRRCAERLGLGRRAA